MRGGRQAAGQSYGLMDLTTLDCELALKNEVELATSALSADMLLINGGAADAIRFPRQVTAFHPESTHGSLALSRHVNAYNAVHVRETLTQYPPPVAPSPILLPQGNFSDPNQAALLPPLGIGYRMNERRGRDQANAGIPSLIRLIERAGRQWHENYLDAGSPADGRPYFVIGDLSAPDRGTLLGESGFLAAYAHPRLGDIVTIQYFNLSGTDEVFDFVLTNATGPLDNSGANSTNFNRSLTHQLIDLLLAQPEVTEIALDPAVAYPARDSRITARDAADTLNPGSRRDMDAGMQVRIRDVAVDLISWVKEDDADPLRHNDDSVTGGVVIPGRTHLRLLAAPSSDPDLSYVLEYDSTALTIDGVPGDRKIKPYDDYLITRATFTEAAIKVTVNAYYRNAAAPFATDRVILLASGYDLRAFNAAGEEVPEDDEEQPAGRGVFIGNTTEKATLKIRALGGIAGAVSLVYDPTILTLADHVTGQQIISGQPVNASAVFSVKEWKSGEIVTAKVTLVMPGSAGPCRQDALSLNRLEIQVLDQYDDPVDTMTMASNPHPVVTLNEVTKDELTIIKDVAHFKISGTVTDVVADLAEGGEADITEVFIHGHEDAAGNPVPIPVSRVYDGAGVTPAPVRVQGPVWPGGHCLALE
jgi:hypothetical protein